MECVYIRLFRSKILGNIIHCSIQGAPLRPTLNSNPIEKLSETAGSDHTFLYFYTTVEHPIKQPLATLLEPRHLEHHQTSPEGAAKRLWMEGLVNEVVSRHVDPVLCSE